MAVEEVEVPQKTLCECVDRTNKFLEQIGFGTNFEVSA
jgi:hypothetical protein